MSDTHPNFTEIRRLRRLLREIAKIAKDASLTGMMEKGARTSALQYNSVLRRLEELGEVSPGLFPTMPEDASFDEVGVAAAQLAGYVDEDEPLSQHPPRLLGSNNAINIKLGARDLDELKELGQVIRENLPDWLRGKVPGCRDPHADAPNPSSPPDAPPHAQSSAGGVSVAEALGRSRGAATLTEVESRLAEVGAKLQAAAEQLRRGDLDDLQRAALAEQLSRLGQEQARLAREHAALREGAV